MTDILIVGVGNAFRSDDGVGPFVAEVLAARGLNATVHAGDGAGLVELFGAHEAIVVVDATRSGVKPGTLIALDAVAERLPANLFHYSTHRFGLAEAVEAARALASLPDRLEIYGIEGQEFRAGIGLSEPVAQAAEQLIAKLAELHAS